MKRPYILVIIGVLLIVAALTPTQLGELLDVCRLIWLQCLVEIHDEAELQVALDVQVFVDAVAFRSFVLAPEP